eukprot:m.109588 g.109588  ORF g.109588 m.109588 type:complete len:161 (+) comp15346_c0_seq34:49-531(+)
MAVAVVQYNKQKYTIEVNPEQPLAELRQQINEITGVAPHAQKLVMAGKTLTDDDATLGELRFRKKAKLMLVQQAPSPEEASCIAKIAEVGLDVAKYLGVRTLCEIHPCCISHPVEQKSLHRWSDSWRTWSKDIFQRKTMLQLSNSYENKFAALTKCKSNA